MCDICSSDYLGDINKKINWRPDRVIRWAKKRGLEITEEQLKQHYNKHLQEQIKYANKKSTTIARQNPKIKTVSKSPKDLPILPSAADNKLLDEVVKSVYDDLTDGKFELKLEHGFKAIEIKQKIEDKTDVENMLLELLNEIRHQELKKE